MLCIEQRVHCSFVQSALLQSKASTPASSERVLQVPKNYCKIIRTSGRKCCHKMLIKFSALKMCIARTQSASKQAAISSCGTCSLVCNKIKRLVVTEIHTEHLNVFFEPCICRMHTHTHSQCVGLNCLLHAYRVSYRMRKTNTETSVFGQKTNVWLHDGDRVLIFGARM